MGARCCARAFEAEAFWISACMMQIQTRLDKTVGLLSSLLRIDYTANIISVLLTLAHVKAKITISFKWTKTYLYYYYYF